MFQQEALRKTIRISHRDVEENISADFQLNFPLITEKSAAGQVWILGYLLS